MRSPILKRFIPIAVLTAVSFSWGIGQYTGTAQGAGLEAGAARLDGIHQAISCLKPEEAVPPVVYVPGNSAFSLTYQDQQFNLGCAVSGFKEYFAPSRWAAVKIKGDGGVDVTGAPNSILVEGANRASVIATPGSAASYRIAIPAEGFVSFDWGYIGGSNLLDQQFWIDVNGRRAESMAEGHTAGNFFSGLLFPGDVLAFNILSGTKGFEIQLSNFEYLSNAISVIERRWEVATESGQKGFFTQWVSIKKPDLTQVLFPGNYDGAEYPVIKGGASASPEWTGYPVIDEDGSTATTHDQYPLQDDGCAFGLKWEDEALFDNGACIIFRRWTVSDLCGGNVESHTQVIKVQGGCPETVNPMPFGQFGTPPGQDGGDELFQPLHTVSSTSPQLEGLMQRQAPALLD